MSYQHDHLAWQQRCNQENGRRNKQVATQLTPQRFIDDYTNDRIKPITKSKYDPAIINRLYQKQSQDFFNNGQINIYELVTQDIKIPEGLLNRGKYCGKSRLRQKRQNDKDLQRKNSQKYSNLAQFNSAKKAHLRGNTANNLKNVKQNYVNSVTPLRTPSTLLKEYPEAKDMIGKDDRSREKRGGLRRLDTEKLNSLNQIKDYSNCGFTQSEANLGSQNGRQIKTYYPEEYFKRTGYFFNQLKHSHTTAASHVSSSKWSQAQPDKFMRFNEELAYPGKNADTKSAFGLSTKSLKKADVDKLSRHSSRFTQTMGSQKSLSLIKSVSKLKHKQKNMQDKATTKTGHTSVKTAEILKMIGSVNKAVEQSEQLERFDSIQKQIEHITDGALKVERDAKTGQIFLKSASETDPTIFFDEANGVYYDANGNVIDVEAIEALLDEKLNPVATAATADADKEAAAALEEQSFHKTTRNYQNVLDEKIMALIGTDKDEPARSEIRVRAKSAHPTMRRRKPKKINIPAAIQAGVEDAGEII